MNDNVDWEAAVRPVVEHVWKVIHERLVKLHDRLDPWLNGMLAGPIPANWREELIRFAEQTRADGLVIRPEGMATLEAIIQGRVELNARQKAFALAGQAGPVTKLAAPLHRIGAVVAPQVRARPAAKAAGGTTGPSNDSPARPPVVKPIPDRGEAFFNYQLDRAQQQLDGMQSVLTRVQAKLSAARIGDSVDLEAEVDEIDTLIIRYNDAIESARQAWLDNSLSGDINSRMMERRNPTSLGLPAFTRDSQARRAAHQNAQISERLGVHDSRMDNVVFGMQGIEWTGTLAGVVTGVGIVVHAGRVGGKLAAAKVVGGIVAFMAADQAAAYGLKAAGASDQTVNRVRFAAGIIGFILYRRSLRSNSGGATSGKASSSVPTEPSPTAGSPSAGKLPSTEPPGGVQPPPEIPVAEPLPPAEPTPTVKQPASVEPTAPVAEPPPAGEVPPNKATEPAFEPPVEEPTAGGNATAGGNLGPNPEWKSTQTGNTSGNSKILRENLGLTKGDGLDAHHIVESTGSRATPARQILDEYQIDINSESNGVALVGGKGAAKDVLPRHHRGGDLHSFDGIEEVNSRLKDAVRGVTDWADGRESILKTLDSIRQAILSGQFPR